MGERFNRDFKITAGRLVIEPRDVRGAVQPALKMEFQIEKSLEKSPNSCRITIHNLKEESRTKLEEKGIELVIEAGYIDERNIVFRGDVDFVSTTKTQTDWITTLNVGDGTKVTKTARINEPIKSDTQIGKVLETATKPLLGDIGLGNLREVVRGDGERSLLVRIINGMTLSGKATEVVDEIATSMGLQYSIQDKSLLFLGKGKTSKDQPVPVNAASGMIGSPERGEKGTVTFRTLLDGRIRPGRKVSIESLVVNGSFRVDRVVHKGDTWGNDWFTEVEASPL